MALDYLPSPGWAVIYGETPSATRWSELGDNDDALATGAGIDDDAIVNRHIAALAVKSENIDHTTRYSAGGNLAAQSLSTTLATNTTIIIPATVVAGATIELEVSLEYNNEGGALKDMQCRVLKNGVAVADRYTGAIAGVYFVTGHWLGQFTVNPGDTVTIQFAKSNTNAGGSLVSRSQYTIKQVK